MNFDFDRYQELKPQLEDVIEKHPQGDFSSWEQEHSTWVGEVKTVDATKPSPETHACAWRLFCAYEMGEEIFGFADQKQDQKALDQLGRALDQAEDALNRLSTPIRMRLRSASFDAVSGVVKVPADMLFALVAAGLRQGVVAATKVSNEHGTSPSRQHRVAAAVVAECRRIFEARTGKPAPFVVRDDANANGPPALFVLFAGAVFKVFGIRTRVDSALRVWREISN